MKTPWMIPRLSFTHLPSSDPLAQDNDKDHQENHNQEAYSDRNPHPPVEPQQSASGWKVSITWLSHENRPWKEREDNESMTHPVKNHFGAICARSQRVYTNRHKQYAHLWQVGLGTFFEPRERDGAGVVGGGTESKNTQHLAFASGHMWWFLLW